MTGFEIPLIIAATAVTAYSQYEEGRSAAAQARAEAAWHDYNAKVAQREDEAERQAAAYETQQHKREAGQFLARQRAAVGKAGVTMEGSPLLVAEDTAAQLALESSMIRITGARRAARWRSQSILDISKAGAARTAAAGYRRAGVWGAGASILGGATDVATMRSEGSPWWPKRKTIRSIE